MYTAVCVPILIPSFQSCKAEANQERHLVVIKLRTMTTPLDGSPRLKLVQPWTWGHLHGRPIAGNEVRWQRCFPGLAWEIGLPGNEPSVLMVVNDSKTMDNDSIFLAGNVTAVHRICLEHDSVMKGFQKLNRSGSWC